MNDLEEFNLGTNPTLHDTDQDGRGDFEEVNGTLTSNPTVADSDDDGFDDHEEASVGVHPENAAYVGTWPVPQTDANSFVWEVTDVQFVRNHGIDVQSGTGNQRDLAVWAVLNRSTENYTTMAYSLRLLDGKIIRTFWGNDTGGFGLGGGGLWNADYETDFAPLIGLSGVGTCDLSDPLTFSIRGTRDQSAGNSWDVVISIRNQRTNTVIDSHTFNNTTAHATYNSGDWGMRDEAGSSRFVPSTGMQIYRNATPLHTRPGLTECLDSDNDGMTDAFESANGLNPNDASDAGLDPDGDGLTNVQESLYGTNPNNANSDGDGIPDGEEILQFTNPLLTSSGTLWTGSLPSGTDLNGNGISDLWESRFGAELIDPAGDADGDGLSNFREAIFGTDPYDSGSLFNLSMTPNGSPGGMTLSFPRLSGKQQIIQTGDSLGGFNNASITPSVVGGEYSTNITADRDQRFFRVSVRDQDLDGDGVPDWDESVLGSSSTQDHSLGRPLLRDTNGDGTPELIRSGDYMAFLEHFRNRNQLASGTPPAELTRVDAARLLMQASFGPTMEDIEKVRAMGLTAWIDDQLEKPATHFEDYIREIKADMEGPRADSGYARNREMSQVNTSNLHTAFARAAVSGEDQLRQRVALALSQILIVSRRDGAIDGNVQALAKYYDRFIDDAFGNYYDLLMGVTLDANMGRYLSHLGNRPPDPDANLYPDENYAREVMQLFSIGIWELNQDGTRKKDTEGNDIPTYGNAEVTEMARVMTGLWYGDRPWGYGGGRDNSYLVPMKMHAEYHDFNEKTLLNGVVIPARSPSEANGMKDLEETILHLVEHPNCAPFISRALIQFLVTSNPTPAYVERVADVFVDNGEGERGDLKAVIRTILLDPEARDPAAASNQNYGLFREPLVRAMHQARLMNMDRDGELLWWDYEQFYQNTLQAPLTSPSVFNFYRPDYTPPGVLDERQLDAPVMEITNSYTAIALPNLFWDFADRGYMQYNGYHIKPDYSDFLPYSGDPEALLDYVNLVACTGSMSAKTRNDIRTALTNSNFSSPVELPRLALYLAMNSAGGAVQR